MAVFWYLDDIVLDWMGQTGPGEGAEVVETRGKVNKANKTDGQSPYQSLSQYKQDMKDLEVFFKIIL